MSIRILCIHGVNTNENGDWFAKWQQSIRTAATSAGVAADAFEFHELRYNAHFDAEEADSAVYAEARSNAWATTAPTTPCCWPPAVKTNMPMSTHTVPSPTVP